MTASASRQQTKVQRKHPICKFEFADVAYFCSLFVSRLTDLSLPDDLMLELGWVCARPWRQAPVHPTAHHLLLVSCLLNEGHRVEVRPGDLQLDLWQGHIHMQGCCRGPAASCPRCCCCCCTRTMQGSVRGHIEVPWWKGVLALTGGKLPCCAVRRW